MKYTLGLDIGTSSVGWAVINEDKKRVEDLGVRLFESAENHKDGASLALPRREARGQRRRINRRKHRLEQIKKSFINRGLVTKEKIQKLHSEPNKPYDIRKKALDEKISDEELFLICFHIAKRRGYKSNRKKADDKGEDKDEKKKVLGSISRNKEALTKYRTVGEMFFHSETKINKSDSYDHSVSREMLENELHTIFKLQRALGNSSASEDFENEIVEIFAFQRPFASGDQIKKLVGKCPFEQEEMRAAKASFSFQYFRVLQALNHLRIFDKQTKDERGATPEERKKLLELAFLQASVKYARVRTELKLSENERMTGVNYFIFERNDEKEEKKKKEPEEAVFMSMTDFYKIRTVIKGKKDEGADPKYWETIKNNRDLLNHIGECLTLYKTDEDIKEHLNERDIPEKVVDALLTLSFSKFGHLSLKALKKIIPFLEEGMTYDKACEKAGDFKVSYGKQEKKLEPIPKEERSITNPVVGRAVSQTIKVVNAIIDKYDSPYEVHIEFGRELAKNFIERKKIEKEQKKNREGNEDALKKIKEMFHLASPGGLELTKYRLWKEQEGKCLYSGKTIDENRLFEIGFVEIDHIVPFSRSFNDSYNNKVLVFSAENRQKGNALPYEYFGGDEARWNEFIGRVNTLHLVPRKKTNLGLKNFKLDTLTSRSLNDTRYISRFLKNYIENTLLFSTGERENKRRVTVVNGATTAYLRKRWGLQKVRSENMRHHALDAVVIAVTGHKIIKDVSYYSKTMEVMRYLIAQKAIANEIDPETGEKYPEAMLLEAKEIIDHHEKRVPFPLPWKGFREELGIRLGENPEKHTKILCKNTDGYTLDEDFSFVRPLFVSRMPRRKVTGRAHADTLRSPKLFKEGKSFVKKPLTTIKLKDLENMRGKDEDKILYEAIKKRLEENGDDPKKAFESPLYKPKKEKGKWVDGPLVRSVKIIEPSQKSGVLVNEKKALVDQDSMVRIDIFSKPNKKGKKQYYIIPIYAYHFAKNELPNKIIVGGKSEKEWEEIDNTFEFEFTLYKNDLVELRKKTDILRGYYDGCDRFTASINIMPHDALITVRGKGLKTLDSIEKYTVDMLGNFYKVGKEKRQDLTHKK